MSEDKPPQTSMAQDDLLQVSMDRVKAALLDEVRVSVGALFPARPLTIVPEKRTLRWKLRRRRMRLNLWLDDHWPTFHLGSCDHRDCY